MKKIKRGGGFVGSSNRKIGALGWRVTLGQSEEYEAMTDTWVFGLHVCFFLYNINFSLFFIIIIIIIIIIIN